MGQSLENIVQVNVLDDTPVHVLEICLNGVFLGRLNKDGIIEMNPEQESKRQFVTNMFSQYLKKP